MNNIIIGTSWHYNINQLKPFVYSWKKYCKNTRLILIVNNDIEFNTINWLEKNNVETLFFTSAYFTPIEIQHSRYFRYLDFLLEENRHNKNCKVFLTDVRDVIFQNNIFEEIIDKGLHVFLEDKQATCGNTEFNNYMLTVNYGFEVAKKFADKPVICSGTTLGDISSIIKYIQTLINQRDLRKVMDGWTQGIFDMQNTIGLDQGLHNFILHNNLIQNVMHENADGVATLACTSPNHIKIIDNENISVYNKIPSVIHQWDRHEKLKKFYTDKFNLL
jgi:hypothetical protein